MRGLAITREVLDAWLVEQAARAGAVIVDETTVVGPVPGPRPGSVGGIVIRQRGGRTATVAAGLTLGADGRRSRLAQACALSRTASRPRRWAVGAYFEGVDGLTAMGEMHVREGHYLGVAPMPDGRANACLVRELMRGRGGWPEPGTLLRAALGADPILAPRFRQARMVARAQMLGPLAVDTLRPACPGLWLVGDAAGFIDPMTGDGIHLALKGAEVAAATAGAVLDGRLDARRAHSAYARALARRLGRKRRFNRVLRGLVGSPPTVAAAARLAGLWPAAFAAVIRHAGDCGDAGAALVGVLVEEGA
jgi:flavin-dependent dehydrogenase